MHLSSCVLGCGSSWALPSRDPGADMIRPGSCLVAVFFFAGICLKMLQCKEDQEQLQCFRKRVSMDSEQRSAVSSQSQHAGEPSARMNATGDTSILPAVSPVPTEAFVLRTLSTRRHTCFNARTCQLRSSLACPGAVIDCSFVLFLRSTPFLLNPDEQQDALGALRRRATTGRSGSCGRLSPRSSDLSTRLVLLSAASRSSHTERGRQTHGKRVGRKREMAWSLEVSEPSSSRKSMPSMARSLSTRQIAQTRMPELRSTCATGDDGAASGGSSSWQGTSCTLLLEVELNQHRAYRGWLGIALTRKRWSSENPEWESVWECRRPIGARRSWVQSGCRFARRQPTFWAPALC